MRLDGRKRTQTDVQAKELIQRARHITIIGHVAPDGDVIGSMLGLYTALTKADKDCLLVLPDHLPQMLRFLPGVEHIVEKPANLGTTDLIVALDVSDVGRLGDVYTSNVGLFSSVPVLNIDHHSTNSFPATSAIVDVNAAASAELVATLLNELSFPIDTITAQCLLVGLVSDTQCFRTPSTTTRTLEVAVKLMDAGASLDWAVGHLYKSHPLSKLYLWGHALSSMQASGGIVWACVTREILDRCKATSDQTDGLIDMLAAVEETSVAALFKEVPDGRIKVSLRSAGRVDVAQIAAHFQGGGHAGAAGFSLDCSLDEAQELVISYIRRQLASG